MYLHVFASTWFHSLSFHGLFVKVADSFHLFSIFLGACTYPSGLGIAEWSLKLKHWHRLTGRMTPTQYMPPRSLSLVGLLQRIYFADPLTCKDSSEVRSRTQTPNNLRKAKELQTRHRKCAHWICRQPGCSNLFAIARSTIPPCALLHPASLLSLSDCMTNSDRKPNRAVHWKPLLWRQRIPFETYKPWPCLGHYGATIALHANHDPSVFGGPSADQQYVPRRQSGAARTSKQMYWRTSRVSADFCCLDYLLWHL